MGYGGRDESVQFQRRDWRIYSFSFGVVRVAVLEVAIGERCVGCCTCATVQIDVSKDKI